MMPPLELPPGPLAVLTSGGLDSAILLADVARQAPAVTPLYVRSGLAWEAVELAHVQRYVTAVQLTLSAVQPLVVLDQPTRDLYGNHWSVTGQAVPDAATPDEAVYLPGRNLLLLTKALLWCHLHDVAAVALGVLGSNPFPDASDSFFDAVAAVASQAVGGRLQVVRPYGRLHKVDVMERGRGLPLEWSFSCIAPRGERHCGQCNKCAERQRAFKDAGWADPTSYA